MLAGGAAVIYIVTLVFTGEHTSVVDVAPPWAFTFSDVSPDSMHQASPSLRFLGATMAMTTTAVKSALSALMVQTSHLERQKGRKLGHAAS